MSTTGSPGCFFCGKTITKKRLEALPNAVTCIDCAPGVTKRLTDRDVDIAGADRQDEIRMVSQPRGE